MYYKDTVNKIHELARLIIVHRYIYDRMLSGLLTGYPELNATYHE